MSRQRAMQEALPPEALTQLDSLLAGTTFGNSDYITHEMHLSCKRRLTKIATGLPIAERLLELISRADPYTQYRVLGDTVVRCAIQHAHKQIEAGVEYGLPLKQCHAIFEETIRLLHLGGTAPLGSALGDRFGPETHCGWIWREDRVDDIFSQSLKHLVHENFGEQLYTLDSNELLQFSKGLELLKILMPRSSSGALSHVHLVVFFAAFDDKTPSSSSEYRLSGSIYLSRRLLGSPWWVAEHLFHEALHQQLYDFRAGHSLLAPDAQREDAPRICSLWNVPDASNGNYWDIHRAVAAFHVYVNLALMATIAERQTVEEKARLTTEYGPNRMVGSRTACARAQYLLEQIRLPQYWAELGTAGQRLVDWFDSVLQAIDCYPPPPGSYVHLLIDRYWRETREVEILLRRSDKSCDIADRLQDLALIEAQEVKSIFTTAEGIDLSRYDRDLAALSSEGPEKRFVLTRDLIINSLPKGYTLSQFAESDRMMRDLVERSSERLRTLLGR